MIWNSLPQDMKILSFESFKIQFMKLWYVADCSTKRNAITITFNSTKYILL